MAAAADGAHHVPPQRRAEKISGMVVREIVHDMKGMEREMLPAEASMLDRYCVGRASLREALRILGAQGLIVTRPGPGGGPMVAPVQSRDFTRMTSLYVHLSGATYSDVLAVRLVMEPDMARLATERQDKAVLAGGSAPLALPFARNPIVLPDKSMRYVAADASSPTTPPIGLTTFCMRSLPVLNPCVP